MFNTFSVRMMIPAAFLLLVLSCKKNNGTDTQPGDKTALNALIDSVTNLYNGSVEGKKAGDYATGSRATLDSVLQLAGGVSDGTYTAEEITNAMNNLRLAVTAFNSHLIQEVSPDALVGFWKFNGNPADSSGHGHDGALKSGWLGTSVATATAGTELPTLVADRYGAAKMAYDFNNAAYVEVPYSADINPTSFTITAWVKRHTTNANNYVVSLDRWNGFKFQLQGNNFPFLTVHTSTGFSDVDANPGTVPQDTWTQIVSSFTNGSMKFYINGELVKTASISGSLVTLPKPIPLAIGIELPKDSYDLTGADPDYAFYGASFFVGSIDDVRMYNKVLSDAEVFSLYTQESP